MGFQFSDVSPQAQRFLADAFRIVDSLPPTEHAEALLFAFGTLLKTCDRTSLLLLRRDLSRIFDGTPGGDATWEMLAAVIDGHMAARDLMSDDSRN